MKLIVGLGNPGTQYELNRHNVGYMLIDRILPTTQEKFDALLEKKDNFVVAKPQTFMNNSGKSVSKIMQFYKIHPDDVYVAHDDLDIPIGKYKIEKGHGPKLHNGINSIEETIGNKEFWRIRIGVENRGENRIPGEAYVLQNFTEEELNIIKAIFPEIIEKITPRHT